MIQFQIQIMNYYILIFYFFTLFFQFFLSSSISLFFFNHIYRSRFSLTFYSSYSIPLSSLIIPLSHTVWEYYIFSSYNAEPWCSWCGSTCIATLFFSRKFILHWPIYYRKTDLYKREFLCECWMYSGFSLFYHPRKWITCCWMLSH